MISSPFHRSNGSQWKPSTAEENSITRPRGRIEGKDHPEMVIIRRWDDSRTMCTPALEMKSSNTTPSSSPSSPSKKRKKKLLSEKKNSSSKKRL
jgi:hypothetical protein